MIQEVFSPLMDEPKTPTTKLLQSPNGLPQEPVPCPRCDSMNTKFCYYNNYNLTQPRHFCKTCRRYWTKGGALRNVPIGGGCRKAKVMPTICTKSNVTKNKSGIWSHDLSVPAGPISWSAPHTAQLVALLRDTSCIQNPNGNLNMGYNRGSPNVPSLLNGFENLYANGQFSYAMQHHQQVQKYQNGMVPGDNVPVSSTQDMYHKIKTNLCNDQLQAIVGNLGGFGTSSVMEPVQFNGTEMGYWNHGLDLQSGYGGSFP